MVMIAESYATNSSDITAQILIKHLEIINQALLHM